MNFKIVPLSTCTEFIPNLAKWAYNLWYKNKNVRLEIVEKDYLRRSKFSSLPVTWVAIFNNQPIGMISLKERDLLKEESLSPWLSALYVLPEFRKKGIGFALIKNLLLIAKSMNYKKIYLFCDNKNLDFLKEYYQARGWNFWKNSHDADGNNVPVYFYDL